MKVYLDDIRIEPEGWVRAYTAKEAIAFLDTGDVEEISLDHDLGPALAGTGYDVANYIEYLSRTGEGKKVPKIVKVHTANPVAATRMLSCLQQVNEIDNLVRVNPYK